MNLRNIVTRIKQTATQSWVAFVEDESGTMLVSVPFSKQQILNNPVFVVDSYFVSREISPFTGEAQTIGDLIDQAIAKLAAQQGITSVLLIVPQAVRRFLPDNEPLYERKVLNGAGGIPLLMPNFNEATPSKATQFLN